MQFVLSMAMEFYPVAIPSIVLFRLNCRKRIISNIYLSQNIGLRAFYWTKKMQTKCCVWKKLKKFQSWFHLVNETLYMHKFYRIEASCWISGQSIRNCMQQTTCKVKFICLNRESAKILANFYHYFSSTNRRADKWVRLFDCMSNEALEHIELYRHYHWIIDAHWRRTFSLNRLQRCAVTWNGIYDA